MIACFGNKRNRDAPELIPDRVVGERREQRRGDAFALNAQHHDCVDVR